MSNDILEKFENAIPREFSGSDIYNRFQFQIAFAAELIIKLTKQGKNAITFIDYLDDVVVIDKSEDSNAIIFYQVKSKDTGLITLNVILKKQWFAKMAYNKELFPNNSKFVLVTNSGVNLDGNYILDSELVSLKEFLDSSHSNIADKIYESLSTSLGKSKDLINIDNYCLLKTDLTITDYERQLKGELQVFAKDFNPKLDSQSLDVIYTKLYLELQNKQKKVYKPVVIDIEKLLFEKSYSTEDFKRLVETTYAVQVPKANELFDFLRDNNLIKREEFANTMKLVREYDKFSIENISNKRLICSLAFERLNEELEIISKVSSDSLIDRMIQILDEYDKIAKTEFYTKYKFFIVTLFLYKLYEGII